ncbi:hypothetical protein [Streptomyces sp. V4I2]|uniref:hypothetical protein n=1 Tax=Streptomyces sp. V4I2 TaxID=3042280 RepID=UPI002783D0CA|nr:hypothetical protein [Streptomyces sp. V4I2]MDQ1045791.1 YD repeat-containing protein [Streptomyces sp. V4I2]
MTSKDTYTYDVSGNTKTRVPGGDTQSLNCDKQGELTTVTNVDGTVTATRYYSFGGSTVAMRTASTSWRRTIRARRNWRSTRPRARRPQQHVRGHRLPDPAVPPAREHHPRSRTVLSEVRSATLMRRSRNGPEPGLTA